MHIGSAMWMGLKRPNPPVLGNPSRRNHLNTIYFKYWSLQLITSTIVSWFTVCTSLSFVIVLCDSSVVPRGVGCGMGRNCFTWLPSLYTHFNHDLLWIHFQSTSRCGLNECAFDEHWANGHPMDLHVNVNEANSMLIQCTLEVPCEWALKDLIRLYLEIPQGAII